MSNIISFFGWTFLPNFVTGNLQTFYYNLTIRAGSPKPQPGTQRFVRDRRRIHAAVILIYLLYTLYEADWEVRREGDFYSDLGVPHGVDEKTLQTRFRRLTLLHHPDKLSDAAATNRSAAEQYYVHLKLARDTLLDPARRFAYDRFGPDVVGWRGCITVRDYVLRGMRALVPFYAGSAVIMLLFGWLGFFEWAKYWRYLAFSILALFELHTITRPYFPFLTYLPTVLNPLTTLAIPLQQRAPYLPFQALRVAHKAIITFFIAINQLGPLLHSPQTSSANSTASAEQQLTRLEQLISIYAVEAPRLLALEGAPFSQADGSGGLVVGGWGLREKVKEWFVTNAVRNDAAVRQAVVSVVEKRAAEARIGVGVGSGNGSGSGRIETGGSGG